MTADERSQKEHDKRLVVTEVLSGEAEAVIHRDVPLGASGLAEWHGVIDAFRGVRGRGDNAGRVGDCARLVTPGSPDRWRDLPLNRIPRVKLESGPGGLVVVSPRPALIGRDPFENSPRTLLAAETGGGGHLPAESVERLSPAEGVSGWSVPDRRATGKEVGKTAPGHRGHLRVDGAIEDLAVTQLGGDNAVIALATLNSPKPAQYRAYLREATGSTIGANGRANGRGAKDDFGARSGFVGGQRLARRKVYLYDARTVGAQTYWTPVPLARAAMGFRNSPQNGQPQLANANGAGRYREYPAPPEFKAKTDTYIRNWVSMGSTSTTTITVDDLTSTELGALLWLLSRPVSEDITHRPAHLRLGLGKPLGFGVVQVDYDPSRTRISPGAAISDSYRDLGSDTAALTADDLTGMRDEYDTLMRRNHPELDVVRSVFLNAAWGERELPVHAPRDAARPKTTSYEWWVTNESRGRNENGRRMGLPLLANPDRSLPYSPSTI
jgi:hypothetical protein